MSTTTPSWDLGTIYKRALVLTKQNKKLWILGLTVSVLATAGSNSSNSGSSSGSRSSSSETTTSSTASKETSYLSYLPFIKKMTQVEADTALNQFSYRFMNNVWLSFRTVPTLTYVATGIEIVTLAIFFVLLGIAASAWSRATLIYGCAQADATNLVSLAESGRIGRETIKTMIALDYLPWMKVLLFGLLASTLAIMAAVAKIMFLVPLIGFIYIIIAIIMAIKSIITIRIRRRIVKIV